MKKKTIDICQTSLCIPNEDVGDADRTIHWYKKAVEQEKDIEPSSHTTSLNEVIEEAKKYLARIPDKY